MGRVQAWIVGVLDLLRHPSRNSLKLLVPVALVLGAGAAVAIGSIPSSDGTITGCVNTVGFSGFYETPPGSLRVIDPTDTTSTDPSVSACQEGEQTLTWNQQGPTGPQGPPGNAGVNGQQGASGKDGQTGTLVGQTNFGITSSKTSKLFLRLKGVSGSEQVKGNGSGFIALGSFAAGAEGAQSVGSASAGAGAGKATIQMFTFTKAVDSTSGELFKDLAQHKVISAMEVIVGHQSGKQLVQVASYELSNVLFTNIQDTGKSGANAERVSGTFTSLKGTVGSGKDSVPTTWNRVTNEPTLTPAG
jgi:type VI secretion system secreted protein Hcp